MAIALEQLLTPDIARPARYLGNELGAVHKPWLDADIRWVLTYPEVYEVGASNLGHIILYSILNAQPRQLCDRAYLPGSDLAAKLKESRTPLFAVESRRSLTDFDILGFSLSYELGATNILEMLSLAQIPLTWQERQQSGVWNVERGSFPLIFAGGQTATSNPEPYADFFDFIALGDGEELLPEIGLVLQEGKAQGLGREELLLDLAQVPGVYVPQFYEMAVDGAVRPLRSDVPERVLRRVAAPIPAYSIGLVPYVETVHDRLVVEIRRGCTRGCRFCQPGMLTRPARDVAPEQVIETIEQGMRATGYNEFSLLSLSCSDYLALPAVGLEIKNRLKDENISLSLPSQRVDRFDENIANIIGGTRKGGLTFAPEAGTQRLRDIINKGLTNEELLRGVKTAYEQGWDRVKLYFMIGLPGETDADVLGIAETMRWLQRECRLKGRKPLSFNVTISNFTPKPHTPFQWHSVSTAEFERKQRLLQQEFRTIRGLKANFTDVRISAMEDFVGRGDRRLGAVVRRAWELGAREDSWWESLERAFAAWTEAIAEAGLTWKYRQVESGEWNLFGHPSPASDCPTPDYSAPLPWDHIDTGISKTWLQEDLHRALAAATVPDCSFDGCSHCGVCGADFGHNVVVPPPPIPQFQHHFTPETCRAQRLRVRYGKLGSMALIGHLDLLRLFDRAIRRAALPIAYTGGFHPSPRIMVASALPLGSTSTGEAVDFDLTRVMEPTEFLEKLAAQLPPDVPLYGVEAIAPDGPTATQQLDQAEYTLAIALSDEAAPPLSPQQPAQWVESILAASELWYDQTTKSGNVQKINLRDRLSRLSLISADALPDSIAAALAAVDPDRAIALRYVGSYRNDGTLLRPEHVVHLLEQASQQPLQLLHSHRDRLIF
ncbi:TIGR03960 family B12-binding radical SAM protein [Thermoleptolyngbya sp. C42_A2020_037]|uniref:TIGR03960 family B12-binding radical SAM protein n=1 Tax=Thermoleptolyngbya sp. C42_A2020_037 TaxID=2747799 RepID=UPI001A0208DE|nr:TIGR03960 family B12-binding radical SAM protein [Thermoleptolyngbya sp. C42_A2020_037]MBF2085190.1 TIGR03960 family B12-binding radical SAM protein [Thermoleptolyngbya sp. C42_A2020_037]